MEFDIDTIHRDCVKQQEADALSRLATDRMDDPNIDDDISIMAVAKRT